MVDIEDIAALHAKACSAGEPTYIDPATGYKVMTSETLSKRGKCCGCGCRHGPYNHANVAMEKRPARISAPALLHGDFADLTKDGIDILFWSGGKDSFLAARALTRDSRAPVAMLDQPLTAQASPLLSPPLPPCSNAGYPPTRSN